jgi:hypothetical protein
VIDEVLGMAITLAGVVITPMTLVLGFALFRFFDIVKLFPGRRLEHLPGGWGVMMDDACAGVYAALVLQVVLRLWPEPQFAWWQAAVVAGLAIPLVLFRKTLVRKYGKKRSRLGDATGARR